MEGHEMEYETMADNPQYHSTKVQLEQVMYPSMPAPEVSMTLEELKTHLAMAMGTAHDQGRFHHTIGHYARTLGGSLTSKSLGELQDLAREAHQNRFEPEKQTATYRKLQEFVAKLTVKRE